ncbi:alpha/beta hydrolase family protein [Streptomyces sp. S.PNR 29]|uniref:alpha/beta hydrolase family protein n=1 Tax=Streptomyces sp. S.PNR 29 TaxID=2973805 RepID=UPI0025AEE493|nr:alpha/beta hydrolase family protein [Streptomyces sp. S.PNR 29]MDN0194478.1 alpha/beta hydrolase family protein [Streptomyces sp. S.PNR 29]
MTSFDTSPQPNVWRALLALAVVFVMLATTGWTALRNQKNPTALAASLAAWEDARIEGYRLPDPQAAPARLARFFASLTERQRTSLARRYPLAVGNMNGAPVELRYRANRIALGQARKVELKRMHDSRLTPDGQQDAGRRMHRFESLMSESRHILAFDPEGSGRVAEVFGNLDKADRVSVIVPGVDTNLLTFQRTQRRYSAPVGMAKSLYAAERAASPSTRTAVIAWADYTAPSGVGMDAATAMRAESGAARLNALLRGLPGGSPVSLFCHSYGSVVCGIAAHALPRRVADIAVAGSPGMRVETASQLRTSAQVWSMRDADDWVQDVPYLEVGGLGHGADPVSTAFGARVLSARGAQGHSGYFEPGTESLLNFADIGVGAYRSVHCAGEDEGCRADLSGTAPVGRA